MDDRSGQRYGNYRLERLLGRGGFAEVYLGEHLFLKTPTAIKILNQEHKGQEEHQHFLQEAQTIVALTHPHIVRLLDFGFQGETPFLVMDYAPGGTLRTAHSRGTRLSLDMVIHYTSQVSEALQFAHDQHVIHRDVKPENMLLGMKGEVLVSDFGIALAVQGSRAQSTQELIGTVQYMAPEQIVGKPHLSSDQYALGIVVYEWLSGRAPFRGSFTEICTQHLHAPLPTLHDLRPDLPSDVEAVLTKALAKKPEERFASVSAFASALGEVVQKTAIGGTRPSTESTVPARPGIAPTSETRLFSPTPVVTPLPEVMNRPPNQASASMVMHHAPANEEQAYETLRLQVEMSDATEQAKGALVVRAPVSLIGQVIYLQPTFWWKQQPGQKDMQGSEVRRQNVSGYSLCAATFKNIATREYVVWTPQHHPLQITIPPGQATLLDYSRAIPRQQGGSRWPGANAITGFTQLLGISLPPSTAKRDQNNYGEILRWIIIGTITGLLIASIVNRSATGFLIGGIIGGICGLGIGLIRRLVSNVF